MAFSHLTPGLSVSAPVWIPIILRICLSSERRKLRMGCSSGKEARGPKCCVTLAPVPSRQLQTSVEGLFQHNQILWHFGSCECCHWAGGNLSVPLFLLRSVRQTPDLWLSQGGMQHCFKISSASYKVIALKCLPSVRITRSGGHIFQVLRGLPWASLTVSADIGTVGPDP